MLGSLLFIAGIALLINGIGSGVIEAIVLGIVLIVIGGALFWRTSATRAYLNQNKRR